MELLNNWIFFVVLYLIASVVYNQNFKKTTTTMKDAGAMMVLLNGLAAILCLLVIPFFEWKWTTDILVYALLLVASVFYTINDRLETTVMSGLEASTFSILNQLSTAFMIILGFVILREPFSWSKIVGSILIIASNVLVFYKRGHFKFDKYVLLGICANISYTVAMFIDVNNSDKLCLPLYVFTTLSMPAILVFILERLKPTDIAREFKSAKKVPLFATAITYGMFIICSIRAYQLGEVTIVAPLISLTVIANVAIGYLFFGEKDGLLKKLLAACIIIIGVILIK